MDIGGIIVANADHIVIRPRLYPIDQLGVLRRQVFAAQRIDVGGAIIELVLSGEHHILYRQGLDFPGHSLGAGIERAVRLGLDRQGIGPGVGAHVAGDLVVGSLCQGIAIEGDGSHGLCLLLAHSGLGIGGIGEGGAVQGDDSIREVGFLRS